MANKRMEAYFFLQNEILMAGLSKQPTLFAQNTRQRLETKRRVCIGFSPGRVPDR